MNQATNKVIFGLLTKEEQSGFCLDIKARGHYDFFDGFGWKKAVPSKLSFDESTVYRLKILPDEWYYCELDTDHGIADYVFKGHSLKNDFSNYTVLRPITTNEIPKKVKTLEDRIKETYPDKEVVMLTKEQSYWGLWRNPHGPFQQHIMAPSLTGFAGYVYERGDNLWMGRNPIDTNNDLELILPVAVLFDK